MARLTHKLWVGIGCAVITGAASGSAVAQAGHAAAGAPAASRLALVTTDDPDRARDLLAAAFEARPEKAAA